MKKIFRNSALALAVLASCGAALAGNDNSNGGCQGNCPTTGGNTTNQGGTGYGGSATAGAAAIAGAAAGAAVVGSGNSHNVNNVSSDNRNTNSNVNANNVSSRNENNVANNNSVRNSNSQGQGQSQSQRQSNSSSNSNSVGATGSGNATTVQTGAVTVGGDTVTYKAAEIPVATAYAAALTASNGTCMGSTSAGAQGLQFGLSVGTTWKDDDCDRRYDANTLISMGQREAALELMSQKPSVKQAIKDAADRKAGRLTKAEADEYEALFAKAASKSANYSGSATAQYTDPIIRARLGLPPLK